MAAATDLTFNPRGYAAVAGNDLLTALYLILVKNAPPAAGLTTTGLLFYNSLLSLPTAAGCCNPLRRADRHCGISWLAQPAVPGALNALQRIILSDVGLLCIHRMQVVGILMNLRWSYSMLVPAWSRFGVHIW